jgi:2Fe-2S iron-sulfur cluster binding domain
MIEIIVNGARRTVESAPDTPLLWVLRDELGLTGTRFGCGAGLCGCCTVHVDGAAMRSCSIAVGDVASRNITTIEHARRSRMPRRRPLPGPVQLARMAAYCPGDLAGLRDRALLLLLAAGFGRSGLVGLDAEQIRFTATGIDAVFPGDETERRPTRIVSVPPPLAPARCTRWMTGCVPPTRASARCSARSTAGAMLNTAGSAPTPSGVFWAAAPQPARAVPRRPTFHGSLDGGKSG